MKRWRANRFGNPSEVLELIDVDLPPIGDYEFVVRVLASGVGLPDLMMVRGEYPLVANPPVNPGQEIVGEVVEAARCCSWVRGGEVHSRFCNRPRSPDTICNGDVRRN